MEQYINSIIQASGTIIAAVLGALIAAGYIGKIVKKDVVPRFFFYKDNDHDAHKIMRKAKGSIYIIASIGDIFLSKHEKHLRSYLARGVKIHYLVQAKQQNEELEKFIGADLETYKGNNTWEATMRKLIQLHNDFKNEFEVKESNLFFTTSYIAIDIDQNANNGEYSIEPVIQATFYQYGLHTGESPATFFTPRSSGTLYGKIKDCILDMWFREENLIVGTEKGTLNEDCERAVIS